MIWIRNSVFRNRSGAAVGRRVHGAARVRLHYTLLGKPSGKIVFLGVKVLYKDFRLDWRRLFPPDITLKPIHPQSLSLSLSPIL